MDSSVLSFPDLSPAGWREALAWVWENGQVSRSRDRETPQGMQQPQVSCVVLTLGTLQWSIRAAVRIYNKILNETASKTSATAHMGEGSPRTAVAVLSSLARSLVVGDNCRVGTHQEKKEEIREPLCHCNSSSEGISPRTIPPFCFSFGFLTLYILLN